MWRSLAVDVVFSSPDLLSLIASFCDCRDVSQLGSVHKASQGIISQNPHLWTSIASSWGLSSRESFSSYFSARQNLRVISQDQKNFEAEVQFFGSVVECFDIDTRVASFAELAIVAGLQAGSVVRAHGGQRSEWRHAFDDACTAVSVYGADVLAGCCEGYVRCKFLTQVI